MYKASQSAVPRTVLSSIQQKKRSPEQNINYSKYWQTPEEKILFENVKMDEPLFKSDLPMSLFTKKKSQQPPSLTPPSTPSSPLLEEQIEFLHNSWKAFRETANGEPDPNIVFYEAKQEPANFIPFDIDRYLAVKLLKELDIDPKLAL